MRSGYVFSDRNRMGTGKPPSLLELCVQKAIDNVRYIGNVGATESELLERILPHCTEEQLMHIENATSERDLSPITNKLWKKFYLKKFGAKSMQSTVQNMTAANVTFRWRQLYQAKLKVQEEDQQKSLEKLAQSFKNESARRQSRQIQICTKVPPAKKRSYGGAFGASSSFSNVKGSNIMRKAKVDYLNSTEMRNRVALKKNAIQTQRSNSAMPNAQSGRGKGSISDFRFTK